MHTRRWYKCDKNCMLVYQGFTERFVTALEAEPQVYRRIFSTICSLGTTLLPSGMLIPKLAKPR